MTETLLILDANVLIDYIKTNKRILKLCAGKTGKVLVPSSVIHEVEQLSKNEIEELGIHEIDNAPEDIDEAMQLNTRISLEDSICIVTARKHNAVCVTNDKKVQKECVALGIKTEWGLNLMLPLVHSNLITKDEAIKTANKISEINAYITKDIIDRFSVKIEQLH